MQVVGIIPARYQSSRYPGKPLADIWGRPMIQRVYENARRASRLNRVLVATDDTRIADAVEAFGGEFMLTKADHPSGTDRVAEVCRRLELDEGDIAVNIQGDEPLLQPVMIDQLVDALEESSGCPMATLAFESTDEADYRNANVVKLVVDRDGQALYFSRSPIPCLRDAAEGPLLFLKHLGFYSYRHAFLQIFTKIEQGKLERLEKLEQLRALEHGYAIKVAFSPVDTLGVDTPGDMERLLMFWKDPPVSERA
jgi:3-deoxy-manno-octulosonate cytidylyltransferase (CMP-KDO synthetase)